MAKRCSARGLRWLAGFGCLVASLIAALPRPVNAAAGEKVALVVIVARNSELTNISLSDLRQAFESERVGDDQRRLIPLNYPPRTPDRVGFDQIVLGRDPEGVGRFWIARKIQGGAGPPRTVASLATLRRVVEKLPGAIAYIRPGQLSSGIRAIRVSGKLPEDPGYPLRYQP
jgi:hypothetical protein